MANFTPQEIEEMLQMFFDTVGKRQYIGARYVPIFGRKNEDTIEWDNSAPYEPLTIVVYQGNSYTSRTYVPIGIEIDDTDYWALSGNYNAQIEQYRQDVASVLNSLDDINITINSLENKIPSDEFTPNYTVKDYIYQLTQQISALLPAANFTQTNTIKSYVDSLFKTISDKLPTSSFPTTVKNYIDDSAETLNTNKIPFPTVTSRLGTNGQILQTNGDGSTTWIDQQLPSVAAMTTAIENWLNNNPSATTTVADNSITTAKLHDDSVTNAKLAQSGGILDSVERIREFFSSYIISAIEDAYNNENIYNSPNQLNVSNILENVSYVNGVFANTTTYSLAYGIIVPPDNWVVITKLNNGNATYDNNASRNLTLVDRKFNIISQANATAQIHNDTDDYLMCFFTYPNSFYDPDNNKLLTARVVKKKNNSDAGYIYVCGTNIVNNQKRNKNSNAIITIGSENLRHGYYPNGVHNGTKTRVCTIEPYKVTKGTIFVNSNPDVLTTLVLYDTNMTYIETLKYHSSRYHGPNDINDCSIVCPIDGFVHVTMGNINSLTSDQIVSDYDSICSMYVFDSNILVNNFSKISNNIKLHDTNITPCGQGMTYINHNIYSFDDGINLGTYKKINLNTGNIETYEHNLGHCNCVDYCEENDTLITYGTNGNNMPTIVLIPNESNLTNIYKTDGIVIPLYKNIEFMNVSASLCFGENKTVVYYIDGIYEDYPHTASYHNFKVHKIRLGIGANDLSANGYGTYNYVDADTYNGTCEVIATYTGHKFDGIDTRVSGNSLQTPQDCMYEDYLYVQYGTAGSNVLKIALSDLSNKFEIIDSYAYDNYDNNGAIETCEPQGICIVENNFYVSYINRVTSTLKLSRIKI
mgnify:CR=1 FL=1